MSIFLDSNSGLPLSSVSSSDSSSVCWSISSAIFSRKRVRACGLRLAHLPSSYALRACLTASSTSALSASATRASTCSLDGLRVSKVLPDFDATHLPLIRSFLGELLRNSSAALDLAPRVADSSDADADAIFPVLPVGDVSPYPAAKTVSRRWDLGERYNACLTPAP